MSEFEHIKQILARGYLPSHLESHFKKPPPFKEYKRSLVGEVGKVNFTPKVWGIWGMYPTKVRNSIPPQAMLAIGMLPREGALKPQKVVIVYENRPERVWDLDLTEKYPVKGVSRQLQNAFRDSDDENRYDIYEGDTNLKKSDAHSLLGRDTVNWRVQVRKVDRAERKRIKHEKKRLAQERQMRESKEEGHHDIELYVDQLADIVKADMIQHIKQKGGRGACIKFIEDPTAAIPLVAAADSKHPYGKKFLCKYGTSYRHHVHQMISSQIQASLGEKLGSSRFNPDTIGCLFDTKSISCYLKNMFARFKTCPKKTCVHPKVLAKQTTVAQEPTNLQTVAVITPAPTPAPTPLPRDEEPQQNVPPEVAPIQMPPSTQTEGYTSDSGSGSDSSSSSSSSTEVPNPQQAPQPVVVSKTPSTPSTSGYGIVPRTFYPEDFTAEKIGAHHHHSGGYTTSVSSSEEVKHTHKHGKKHKGSFVSDKINFGWDDVYGN